MTGILGQYQSLMLDASTAWRAQLVKASSFGQHMRGSKITLHHFPTLELQTQEGFMNRKYLQQFNLNAPGPVLVLMLKHLVP